MRSTIAFIFATTTATFVLADDAGGIDFNRDVRPILSANCYKCHGPDEQTREADLRLDEFDDATLDRGGYSAIQAGNAKASEIIARILTADPDSVMPPPETNKKISEQDLATLKRWINAGAVYEKHWSFVPPEKVEPPTTEKPGWNQNAIDRFVLGRITNAGLQPAQEADRYTLVRRVSLDLIGIPPTPEEADAFVNDESPKAYEKLIDRLLTSPHYGERWARRWLDIARYADTNGYEKDRPRSIWPYRDWVIDALNDGMPYDQFIIKQLAGDMLSGDGQPNTDDLVATGFHRNTMINEEGGADPLEYRFHAMVDRTNTTGTALLGLTVGCTQCHTHKYDPITHIEYYGLMAFLNNADEPTLELPDADVATRRAEQIAKADRMAARRLDEWRVAANTVSEKKADKTEVSQGTTQVVPADDAQVEQAFRSWIDSMQERSADWTITVPARRSANLARFDEMPDGSLFAQGDVSKEDTYDFTLAVPVGTTAIRLEALPDERLPKNGPGRAYYEGPAGDFMLADFTIQKGDREVAIQKATVSFAGKAFGKESSGAGTIDDDKHTGWSIGGRPGERHVAVFTLADPITSETELDLHMLFFRHFAAPLGRLRFSVTSAKQPAATTLDDDIQRMLLTDSEHWSAEQTHIARTAWLSVAPELAKYNKTIADLRRTLPSGPTTMIFRERPSGHSRETRRHHRGEYVNAEETVEPTVPAAIGEWPAETPKTRLEFSRWLVSDANPLAARVKMNRDWAAFFGTGIVRTLDDFGSQGEAPSHPDLLDWLAVSFIESGWDTKAMHRKIVMSATYRQDSAASRLALVDDQDNRFLSHGPRRRLDAESIRDTILTASGLLTRTLGGPSVYPPQPDVVARENFYAKFEWKTETGPNRYRRGLYTFAKRTNPYAMFNTFDGPTGTVCVARRERSNTPLQALTMLNDTVIVEAARHLGEEAARLEDDASAKATWIFRNCLVRPPSDVENDALLTFYNQQRSAIANRSDEAAKLMDKKAATAEEAAWMLVARAVLNTDELIVKR